MREYKITSQSPPKLDQSDQFCGDTGNYLVNVIVAVFQGTFPKRPIPRFSGTL